MILFKLIPRYFHILHISEQHYSKCWHGGERSNKFGETKPGDSLNISGTTVSGAPMLAEVGNIYGDLIAPLLGGGRGGGVKNVPHHVATDLADKKGSHGHVIRRGNGRGSSLVGKRRNGCEKSSDPIENMFHPRITTQPFDTSSTVTA